MKERQLTADQIRALAPYERNFEQATKAAYCSYPGQAAIETMCDIWQSITGTKYPYQPGCAHCLLNLVRDLGTIYFAQKDAVLVAEVEAEMASKAPAKKPAAPNNTKKGAKK